MFFLVFLCYFLVEECYTILDFNQCYVSPLGWMVELGSKFGKILWKKNLGDSNIAAALSLDSSALIVFASSQLREMSPLHRLFIY